MSITTEEFMDRVILKHGNRYSYEKTIFISMKDPIVIICKIHGEFIQQAGGHSRGNGCIQCRNTKFALTLNKFIEKAQSIHGDLYNYSKSVYVNSQSKIIITCNLHGDFLQRPSNHLIGQGCPDCFGNPLYTTNKFVEKCNIIHQNKYSYEKTKYVNSENKIIVTCHKHGDFSMIASNHIRGYGCQKCGHGTIITEDFIERATKIHNGKYQYLNDEISGSKNKIDIICPEHGIFKQSPDAHLAGKGCIKCGRFSQGEHDIDQILQQLNLNYKYHHNLKGCVHKKKLFFDFVVSKDSHMFCIELNGEQHYDKRRFMGLEFDEQIIRDQKKIDFCRENNIPLLIIRYDEIDNAEILIKEFLSI